ncbi:MAG: hypothetical protein IRY90_20025, partial [Actinomadura rubrobrunea]|nr:hypothetical protein [Actinomadura rubrobrunea]
MDGSRVMGVDACRAGWIGVVLDDDGPAAWHAPEIGALADAAARRAP